MLVPSGDIPGSSTALESSRDHKHEARTDDWVSTLVSQMDSTVLRTALSPQPKPAQEEVDWWGATVSFLGGIFQPPMPEDGDSGEIEHTCNPAQPHDGGKAEPATDDINPAPAQPNPTTGESKPGAGLSDDYASAPLDHSCLAWTKKLSAGEVTADGGPVGCSQPTLKARVCIADPIIAGGDSEPEHDPSQTRNPVSPKARFLKTVTFRKKGPTANGEVEGGSKPANLTKPPLSSAEAARGTHDSSKLDADLSGVQNTVPSKSKFLKAMTFAGTSSQPATDVDNRELMRRNTIAQSMRAATSFRKGGSAARGQSLSEPTWSEVFMRKTAMMNLGKGEMEAELTKAKPVPRLKDGTLDLQDLTRESVWGRTYSLPRLRN